MPLEAGNFGEDGIHVFPAEELKPRLQVTFSPADRQGGPREAILKLKNVTTTDDGNYSCLVIFKNDKKNLQMVSELKVYSEYSVFYRTTTI